MKKVIIAILLILGLCGLVSVLLPFHLFPFERILVPKDRVILADIFDQKLQLPGYKIVKVSGLKSGYASKRVLEVRVLLETGEKPITCDGIAVFIRSDPSYEGFSWQTLECAGAGILIDIAQSAVRASDKSQPPKCYKNETASVLYHWVKNGKITTDKIRWPEIKALTEEMLAGQIKVNPQVILFDPSEREVIDLAPQEPAEKKAKKYFLRCDGTLLEYSGKTGMDIIDYRNATIKDEYQFELGPITQEK